MSKKRAWGMFIVLYLSCLAIGITQMKVPPIMTTLVDVLGVSMTEVAWLCNVFFVAGIILAIPCSFILNKLGPKKMGIFILVFLIIGGLLGVLTTSFPVMLISRVIEGIGFSFGTILGMVLISQWFEPKVASIATGIFATFPSAGAMIMLSFGAGWAAKWGWRSLWWIGIIYSAVMLIVFAITIKVPEAPPAPEGAPKLSMWDGIKNGRAVILGICFGSVIFVLMAFSNLYLTIFTEYYQLPVEQASVYAGMTGSIGVICSIICGILIAKTSKPGIIMLGSFILLGVACFFTFTLTPGTYAIHVIATTALANLVIPAILCLAATTAKRPEFIGAAMAICNLIYCVGDLLSTPVVTSVVEASGWAAARTPLVLVCVLGAAATIIFLATGKKKA